MLLESVAEGPVSATPQDDEALERGDLRQGMPLSDRQIRHRQYLQSPVWKAKREEALAHYGCVCNRCHRHGTDVHHRTYKRVGGQERMEDLEVLCRECHEAHHAAERGSKPRKKTSSGKRSLHRNALYRYLTTAQRDMLCKRFAIGGGTLYTELISGVREELLKEACRLLGVKGYYPKRILKRHRNSGRGGPKRATDTPMRM